MNNFQRILKRILACTAAIVLAVTLCLAAAAEVAYQPTAQFFVNDFADVLSAQAEQEIVELGRALQQQTGAQAVAVTVPSLDGQSVEDYAIDLANSWGIGQAEEDNGVLILIAVEERKLRIEVGLGLEGTLPDGKTGRIMDEYMTPSLRQNDYSTGMLEGYKAVASQIYQEYGIEAPELSGYEASNNQNTGNRQDIPTVLTLISPIALVILLLILRLVSHGRGFPFFWRRRRFFRRRRQLRRGRRLQRILKQRISGVHPTRGWIHAAFSSLTRGVSPAVNLPYRQKCYRHSSYFRWGHAVGTIPVQKTD